MECRPTGQTFHRRNRLTEKRALCLCIGFVSLSTAKTVGVMRCRRRNYYITIQLHFFLHWHSFEPYSIANQKIAVNHLMHWFISLDKT